MILLEVLIDPYFKILNRAISPCTAIICRSTWNVSIHWNDSKEVSVD